MAFPKGFVWGAAAASYQLEGAAFEDGKGPSVWDMMCRKEGAIWNAQSGDVACDHYHRYKEDVALMKHIGLKAYRLSVSWPRVLPGGVGAVNPKGIGFYSRLVDELLAAGVEPWITLFHWDYPYELYCRGGWLNPESPRWFADYAKVVIDALSDRVTHWMTMNEPQCFVYLGHGSGYHAPGDRLGTRELLRITHHALLAHGLSVQSIRAHSKRKCEVGFAPVAECRVPASDSAQDIDAARRAMFEITSRSFWSNTLYMDPVYLGRYPDDAFEVFGADMPTVAVGDLDTICQRLDFFGMNTYQGRVVRAGKDGRPEPVPLPLGHGLTTMDWPIVPDALRWGPRFLHERYRLPIVVTENGMGNVDWIALDGRVHDPQRIDFLTRYLRAYGKAHDDGVPIRGYFLWSIMDNFEWAFGYKQRFGIIYVDYPTQRRILKDSALWYKQVIATNGESLLGEA